MKRKRKERRLWPAAFKTAEAERIYLTILLLQPFQLASRNGEAKGGAADALHHWNERHCVVCNVLVDNENLGGHSRKSGVGRGYLVLPLRELGDL
jgi:hypothetical protein